ncbi:MAG: peroxiredoxin family protein [Candidatus Aminicenantes bacterium]|nr:peroxiredoxin family protein [Candidatus Aminicenantes bacterium]
MSYLIFGKEGFPRFLFTYEANLGFTCQKAYFLSLEEAPIDRNRPYLLIFFNVSCHLCWDELFVWKDFIETRRLPVQLVGITRDPEPAVELFIKKYSITFPIILDQRSHLFRLYQVKLEPFWLLLQGEEVMYRDNLMEPIFKRREKLEQCLLSLR